MHRAPLLPALFLLAACTGELADLDSRDGAAPVVDDGGAPRSGDGGTPAVDGSTPAPDDGGIPVPEGWTCPAVEVFTGVADEVTYGPHPRVLMAAADLPAVRARWAADPFGTRARFEGSSNAIDVAFRVLMDDDGDEDLEPVVAELVRRVNAMSRYAKDPDSPIFESAATLDLAWDYLSAGQRERLADAIVAKVRSVSVLDSPTEDTLSNHRMEHVVTGHAIAAFTLRGTDERLYDHDGFGEWFWERLLPDDRAWVESGIHHQGTIYFGLRAVTLVMLDTFTHSLTGRWAFPGCGRRIAFTPLLGGTPHMNALRWGDASTLGVGGDSTQQALVLAGAAWGDPHVLAMADSGSFEGYSSYAASPVARLWEMIFRDAAIVPDEDYEALGTAWPIPGPIGPGYSHRSSNGVYGSDDVPVPVYFTMSGERFVGGHQHAAVGQSTFWYRGVLWGDSGSYTGAGPSKIFSDYWWDQVYGSTSKSGVPLVYDRSVDYGRDILRPAADPGAGPRHGLRERADVRGPGGLAALHQRGGELHGVGHHAGVSRVPGRLGPHPLREPARRDGRTTDGGLRGEADRPGGSFPTARSALLPGREPRGLRASGRRRRRGHRSLRRGRPGGDGGLRGHRRGTTHRRPPQRMGRQRSGLERRAAAARVVPAPRPARELRAGARPGEQPLRARGRGRRRRRGSPRGHVRRAGDGRVRGDGRAQPGVRTRLHQALRGPLRASRRPVPGGAPGGWSVRGGGGGGRPGRRRRERSAAAGRRRGDGGHAARGVGEASQRGVGVCASDAATQRPVAAPRSSQQAWPTPWAPLLLAMSEYAPNQSSSPRKSAGSGTGSKS